MHSGLDTQAASTYCTAAPPLHRQAVRRVVETGGGVKPETSASSSKTEKNRKLKAETRYPMSWCGGLVLVRGRGPHDVRAVFSQVTQRTFPRGVRCLGGRIEKTRFVYELPEVRGTSQVAL